MFSSRTEWNTTPNRLSELLEEKRRQGVPVIDLTESNPTRCGFSYPQQAILNAFSHPSILEYNPDPQGLLSARKAIADYSAQNGMPLVPEQLFLTASTSEAYLFLLNILCNSGDEIIVPQPSYPLFEYLGQLSDITIRSYRLIYDGEWHIDFSSLQKQITKRTRAFILVHPNNPTGSYVKQYEYEKICTLASTHRTALIIDEVFGPYRHHSNAHNGHPLEKQDHVLTFSLNGISKLCGLPQLKLSWIAIHGSSPQVRELSPRLEIICDTFLSVNTPVQLALPALLSHAADIQRQIHFRICEQYAFLQNICADSPLSVLHCEGGWYAILQLPYRWSDLEWSVHILQRKNILVQPGYFYDLEQKSCIIVSLLPLLNIFKESMYQIRHFIEEN